MNLLKALIPAGLLTWIASTLISHNGATGGMLYIHQVMIQGHAASWSWPLFVALVGLAWLMFTLLD